MVKAAHSAAAQRFRIALDLYEAGEKMMRQKLRRQLPDADENEIERRLIEWLHHRPGAEHGDCTGRPVDWPGERL
jgi:hypothetical protein